MPLRLAITVFFLLSGATALVYQVIWVRMLGLVVGHSVLAISTVVATYMAGLGLGARTAGGAAARLRRPLMVYGALEMTIGLFALASPWVLDALSPLVAAVGTGALHVPAALLTSALALLMPTSAMGATLPLLTRWYARDEEHLGRDMGWLYAINTTGAVVGAGLAGFALLPRLGQPTSLAAAAAVNMTVGLAAVALGARVPLAPTPPAREAAAVSREPPLEPTTARRVLLAFALSGGAAMVNQVAWSRGFTLFTGSTTYAFSLIVCAFIAGLALGGHVFARRVDRSADRVLWLATLNVGIALSAALIIPVLGEMPLWLLEPLARRADSFEASQRFTFAVLAALLALPTFLMGGTYPVATRILSPDPEVAAEAVGRAYAWNTSGAIIGALAGGMALIPLLQLQGALWFAVGINLLAAAVLLAPRRAVAWSLPALAVVAALLSPPWNPRHVNLAPYLYASELVANPAKLAELRDSGQVLFHEDGLGAAVTVLQRSTGARVLRINGKTDASTEADAFTQGFVGVLSGLLSDGQRSAMLLGLGSGMSLATALNNPLDHVVIVELLPEVVRGSEQFGPLLGDPLHDPRAEVRVGDGRYFILHSGQTFDAVNIQPTNLFISGMSSLVTVESFAAMRDCLEPGGVAQAWVQGYLLRDEDFKTILRTWLQVFPEAHLWNVGPFDFVLTGHTEPFKLPAERTARRIDALQGGLAERFTALSSVADLQRHYLLGPEGLRRWVGQGPLHRDRDPFLEFQAPRGLYGDEGLLDPFTLFRLREPLPITGASPALREELAARRDTTARVDAALADGGLAPLTAALALDPNHPALLLRWSHLRYEAAVSDLRAGDIEAARRGVDELLATAPQQVPALRLSAVLHLSSGRVDAALRDLERARDLQPWNVYGDVALGTTLLQVGRTAEGLAVLDQARERAPKLPELQF